MCCGSIFKLPTEEYRFVNENISIDLNKKVFVDPSIWCIHGEYEAHEKYIITKSNVTAHLVQIHPFTFGWTADLHFGNPNQSWISDAKRGIDRLSLCNPTLTAIGGDIVEPSLEGLWFEDAWNYMKDKLSNNLWIKGNHDVGGEFLFCYHYYDWFERLWCLRIGKFKFIGFDTFNERIVLPKSCYPGISLHDMIWLKKRLSEDQLFKVMLFHHPLSQWYFKVRPYALNETLNVKCAFFGHDPKINYEEVLNIPCYGGGECAPANPMVGIFTKSGDEYTFRVMGDINVAEASSCIKIETPSASSINREVKPIIPIRLVERHNKCQLNLIVLCPSESVSHIQFEDEGDTLRIISDVNFYVLGKEIYSTGDLYDSWRCSCGTTWNSYYVNAENPIELHSALTERR